MHVKPLLVTVLAAWASAQEPQPIRAPLTDEIPGLLEQSVWRQELTGGEGARGAWPVGNGRVFAHLGLAGGAATLLGITGPSYRGTGEWSPEGSFGRLDWSLHEDGVPLALPDGEIGRVRGAGFVVTEQHGDSVALTTLVFAPPDGTRLLQVVEVRNLGTAPRRLRLVAGGGAGEAGPTEGTLVRRSGAGATAVVAALSLGGARVAGTQLTVDLPELEAGGVWRGVLEIATFAGGELPAGFMPDVAPERAQRAAERTLQWWAERLHGTLRVTSDHVRLADLTEDWKVNLLTQQCAQTGAVVAMLHHRRAALRESNGAMLGLLRLGLHDAARELLEFWWRAVCSTGRIAEHVPLDVAAGHVDGEAVDWAKLAVPDGDLASWLLLQHFWYWRTTRDTALIERHWRLIDACLRAQRRVDDCLIGFSGSEPWLGGGLAHLGEALGDDPRLVHDAPELGRRSWSFASSVLFLIALQAYGDLLDGRDRLRHPEKWAGDGPEEPPSRAYRTRSIALMQALEHHFWNDEDHRFAPALSPIGGAMHREPLANANLMPLFVGWTFPSGERSRLNLESTLARLWREGARIGTTATVGHATGDLQGMLLVALSERDAVRRMDVFDSVLDLGAPAGEWPTFHDAGGRAVGIVDPEHPARLSPGVGGVNLDALLFAVTGIRYAAVPGWDDKDIRLELRLPHGADWVTVRSATKDARTLDLYFRRSVAPLSEAEIEANAELAPDRRRDPSVPHERLNFVVQLVRGEPPAEGYWDVALNAMGTVFVRYLKPDPPAGPDEHDFRRIEDQEFVTPDVARFLPDGDSRAAPAPPPHPAVAGDGPLVLTWREAFAAAVRGGTAFDTGLPWPAEDLAAALFDEAGEPRRPLVLDWRALAPLSDPRRAAVATVLDAFRAAGGPVLGAGFLTRATDAAGAVVEADADSAFAIGSEPTELTFTVPAEGASDGVLHLGGDVATDIAWNGAELGHLEAARTARPDRTSRLVRLRAGENRLELRTRGPGKLYVRLVGDDGRAVVER